MLPVGVFKVSLAGLTKFKGRENEMNFKLEDVIKWRQHGKILVLYETIYNFGMPQNVLV